MESQQTLENSPFTPPKAPLEQEHQQEYDSSPPFSPRGRLGRADYTAYLIALWLAMAVLSAVIGAVFGATFSTDSTPTTSGALTSLTLIVYIPLIVIATLFMIRRLHDLNWSGWFCLASMVPLVNIIIMVFLFFVRGTDGPNRFGPPRKPPTKTRIVVALILPAIFVLGILAAIAIPSYQDYIARSQGM